MPSAQRLIKTALRTVRQVSRMSRRAQRQSRREAPQENRREPQRERVAEDGPSRGGYAGDYQGSPTVSYEPVPDDRPDPGEVVWAWVPFEEDHSQGKDRPVLVIGRDGDLLLALQMSSKDHDEDAADEARWGRHWVDVGSGPWDGRGRPSEVRVDRVLRLDPGSIRRIGAVLDRERFDEVAAGVREHT